ncbi:Wzz/FepE/Etk N-terminal domain-containing protein [Microbacteriaceae bacterium K1510]|nr:Wzz/FepE/Etk N-terminal domain-containing protein [Microbacteriaceae bacterium K1510]
MNAAPPAPVAAPYVPSGEPDMRGLGRALWQKRTLILGVTLVAAGAAFLVVNAITPRYRSESRILLETRENVFLRAEADKTNADRTTIDAEAVASQIQVVLSRDLARQVIQKEGLADNPEFDSGGSMRAILGLFGIGRDPSAMTKEERTLEAYYERINVSAVEKSRVISIDFSSANPDLAARVANAIADTYLSMQQTAKQDQTRAAGNWLAGEIDKMRKKVEDAEAKVEDYRSRSNLFLGANNTSLPTQQLSDLNAQIAAARGQKADLETRAKQLRDLIRSGKPIESADIANSDAMRRLIEQRIALRSQLAEQSTTLLDQHPRIKELRAQIAEVDRQIRTEGERLARQLDNDAQLASDRFDSLTASIDQVKRLASQTNEQDVQLRALEREAKTQRDLLESYLTKYREASARDNIIAAPAEARIISRASPALKPAYPKKMQTVLIAAFAAFALSAGFTVTGALLSAPTPSPYTYGYGPVGYAAPGYEPTTQAPPVQPAQPMAAHPFAPPSMPMQPAPPSMPTMPHISSPSLTPTMAAAPAMAAAAAPAMAPLPVSTVEQIARSLRLGGDAGRRVTVVGTARNVGTTYAAITLARALAQEANVILVDLAFGAPNLSVISTDPNAPGLAELVRGTASFGDIITRDQYSNVHLIATGNVGHDGPMFAASPMMATVIEALVRSYDHVVLDIGSAADIAVERFAPLAQRAVLVASDPANPATRAARERLMLAGFADVTLLAGVSAAAAA